MSLLLTFMELDKLYESTMSRQDLISHIKASGRNYNFNTKSTEQLFRIWERIQKEDLEAVSTSSDNNNNSSICGECGARLTDGGLCPVCDDGEEDLYEWVDANGATANNMQKPSTGNGNNIVTIVYDIVKHKLRAQADDGIHGRGYVAFPNNLRTAEGQQYEVETLTWTGKNYRVSGNIKPI